MGEVGGQGAGRAFLRHPSIRALLEAEGGAEGPDEAVRRRARRLVDRALRLGWDGPPFDLDLLASVAGYRVVYTDVLGEDQDGCIDAVACRILVSSRLSLSRQRFTLAHELAHTLLPDFGSVVRRHATSAGEQWSEQSPVEQICQVGAAELLMPLAAFQAASASAPVSIDGIATLAHLFGASFEAAARRRVALAPRGVALVIARPVDGGSLTVVASVQGGSGKPLYLPWSRLLPLGSIAYQVWACGRTPGPRPCRAEAVEDWGHLGRLGRRRVEAVALPLSWESPNAVLCLLHPVHDPPAKP